MKSLRERVNAVIEESLRHPVYLNPELRLAEDLGFDSMRLIELIGRLEDEFDVVIPVQNLAHIRTVGDVYAAAEHPEDHGIIASGPPKTA